MRVVIGVRQWCVVTVPDGDGRPIQRTQVRVIEYETVADAQDGYERSLRRRWVPDGAVDSGVEPIGFTPAPTGTLHGPAAAAARLRDRAAADALARMLASGRARREAAAGAA